MTKVMADISMSLDGFIAGPDDTFEQPLGAGGDRLHEWVYDLASWRQQHGMEGGEGGQDSEIIAEGIANIGAVVIGRRMFDLAEEPWGDEPPFRVPVFVVTHRPRETLEKAGGTTFHFVTDGIESAVEQAKAAAGDKHVGVGGGANVIQQLLQARLLDELQIHLVPIFLGGGRRLFDEISPESVELEVDRVVTSPGVTHLRYRRVK
ncbi:MAG TPA: dihydrofolate reductase family protein [Thermomicrobiales bacterium]|jgi:dihydrofolate reductase